MLSIPKPCHEDFNKMSPTEKGAFCDKCRVNTIDFRGMSNEEILLAIKSNQEKVTCGQIFPHQIRSFNAEFSGIKKVQRKRFDFHLVASFVVLFLISSCKSETERDAAEIILVREDLNQLNPVRQASAIVHLRKAPLASELILPPPPPVYFEDELIYEEERVYKEKRDTTPITLEVVEVNAGPQLLGELSYEPLGGITLCNHPDLPKEKLGSKIRRFFRRIFYREPKEE